MKNRCEYHIDLTNNRTRKCKCYNFYRGLCWLHFQKVYEKTCLRAASIIQSHFRGKKVRNKVLNIYCKLPDELQTHIRSFMIKDHIFIHRFIPCYTKIIKSRWIKNASNIMHDYKDPNNRPIRYVYWLKWIDNKDYYTKKIQFLESIKTTFYRV